METTTSFLTLSGNRRIAYHLSEGKLPGVIFMGGFKSDMSGTKALALEAYCKSRGQRFIRFDYTGHGLSSGEFSEGTIGGWKQDALDVIDQLGAAQNILAGSSMGAWLALLVARERKEKVAGLLGISSAPDFTERMIWQQMTLAQKKQLKENGVFYAPSCYGEAPYPITRALIEEGRSHLLLDGPIAIDCPVRLVHGTEDKDVPWKISLLLLEKLAAPNVSLQFIKNGDHRLNAAEHIVEITSNLGRLLDFYSQG